MDADLIAALQQAFINIGNTDAGKGSHRYLQPQRLSGGTGSDYDNERAAQKLIRSCLPPTKALSQARGGLHSHDLPLCSPPRVLFQEKGNHMIIFDHVSKVYPNGTVGLDDDDLTIQDGEFVAIIGRSGAGKSTLLRSVNRMHQITSGTLTVNGTDVSTLSGKSLRRFRRGIGMVFQSFNLVTRTTVSRTCSPPSCRICPSGGCCWAPSGNVRKDRRWNRWIKVGILDKAFVAPTSSPAVSSSGWRCPHTDPEPPDHSGRTSRWLPLTPLPPSR